MKAKAEIMKRLREERKAKGLMSLGRGLNS